MSAAASSPNRPNDEEANDGSSDSVPTPSTLSVLKQLRAGSTGFRDFYAKVWGAEIGESFYGFLENPAYFVLRIVLIVIGSVYLNDCQAEPMLPIFLIVFGAVGLLMQIIDPWETAKDTCVYYLLAFFSFCWWITGIFWIAKMDLPNMAEISGTASSSIYDLMERLMRNHSINSSDLLNDQLTVMNNTMNAVFAPEKHCAFPVYALACAVIYVPIVMMIGSIVLVIIAVVVVTITAICLY